MPNPEWMPQMARRTIRPPVDGILEAIGDTPLVRLRHYPDAPVQVWAKLESANPGGSAKDRPALGMLRAALASGRLRPGGTVVESSSGNMGIGLAQACQSLGLSFVCVVDSRARPLNVQTMRAFGADVREIPAEQPAGGDPLAARLALVADLLRSIPGAYWPNQYANPANARAHAEGTVREIDEALGGELDVLLVATSTAGTLVGCQDHLRRAGRETRVVAVDAVGSALFGGRRRPRRMPGLGAGMVTPLSRAATYDDLVRVDDLDCVIGCRRLLAREAILAGGSSGGVMVALDRIGPSLEPGARCAVILPDGGGGYLDTVYDDGWVERELGCDPRRLEALSADVRPLAAAPA